MGGNIMKIEEDKLKLYLNTRKKYIEFKKYSGIAEIVSGLSMLITLICSNFDLKLLVVKILLFIGYFISVIILLYGIYQFVISLKNYFTIDLCFKEISCLDDTKKRIQYVLVIQDNVKGHYLLVYNVAWGCYLFPSFSSDIVNNPTNSEEETLLKECKRILGIEDQEISIKSIGSLNNYKLNVGEKCFMNYEFRFFVVQNVDLKSYKKLKINGLKFKWIPIDKMYSNKRMMKKNMEVIDYVNNHTNIAKI